MLDNDPNNPNNPNNPSGPADPAAAIAWRRADFWHAEGRRMVCDLCPFRCVLAAGETARCAVRRCNANGDALETATFATSVWHWHSVERKPLYHFRPGLRTLTLAAPGCNLRCDYCQNAVLSQFGRDPMASWSGRPLDPVSAVDAAHRAGAGIAISYTEPTLAAELTQALAREIARGGRDIPLIWKSNGFITQEALATLAPLIGAVNIDLKAADERAHRQLTGAPLGPILAAAASFKRLGVWVEISTPLINGVNTESGQIREMAAMVAAIGCDVPWHLVRVVPEYRMQSLMPTSPALLERARDIGVEAGLRHVYVERALGASGRQTRCPHCAAIIIERAIGALEQNHLVAGRCPVCNEAISGVWHG